MRTTERWGTDVPHTVSKLVCPSHPVIVVGLVLIQFGLWQYSVSVGRWDLWDCCGPDSSLWGNALVLLVLGVGLAQMIERRTSDWKVAGSIPDRIGERIFFSRVHFLY